MYEEALIAVKKITVKVRMYKVIGNNINAKEKSIKI
ncbi:hypothetical protein CNEO4_860040 [Clostridium neonatale]|uniref:Uncharacterized protein n=1 Tax=Clostridium neonatale TaxID=137838 RepID=A0AA86JNI9_9CLOT|nr:hypothetical protein CNEO_43532 [Clostridium neonatale]CAI3232956.1 hypothetical protein CNEO2_10165 [Clostridium neonatale]CAI3674799.1 hypothetical protein CNEO4_640005 [Clostridium neonatale]CAI3685819.1 hypothetical protein CNEO4_620004 [Clostridium neonatale]CAI3698679.1 hypothetical protein CNEO4_650005 [Clostridium neonatale]